jgi:O-antigen/teichoic acid export membrane protein
MFTERLSRALLGGRFRRGFMATVSFDALSRICGAAASLVLLRVLSVADFAYVVLFLAISQTLGTASTGGIRMGYLRMEAERISRQQGSSSGFTAVLTLGVGSIGALSLIGFAVAETAGIGSDVGTRAAFWACVLVYSIGQASTDLLIYRHQAHLAFRQAGQVNAVRAILLLGCALVIAFTGSWSGLAAAGLLAASIGMVAVVLVHPVIKAELRCPIERVRLRSVLKGTHWLTIYYLASAAYANADIFVVAAVLGKYDTAAFGAAQRYYSIVLGAVPALMALFRVRTAQVDILDSFEAQRGMLLRWIKRLTPIALGVCLVAGIAAPFLLPLIDRGRYPESIAVFQILLVYALAVYVILPAPSLLMAQHRYRLLAMLAIITVLANVVGDAVAAWAWGIVGVAVSASLVNVIASLVTTSLVLRSTSQAAAPTKCASHT